MKKSVLIVCLCGILVSLASCDGISPTNEITIYGNVIDRTTGQPLYNVLIQEKNKVGGSTVTGNDGNYEFTLPLNGSSDGRYYLVASKDKYSSSEYELNMSNVDKNRRVKVDFQLVKESITYTGTVLDSKNQPIFDAHISAQYSNSSGIGTGDNIGTTTMTDANGVYTLELPRPKYSDGDPYNQWKFAITATKSGYKDLTHVLNQNADDMGRVITLNFIMRSNVVTVAGKVTDSNGTAQQDALLEVYENRSYSSNKYMGSAMTDGAGCYSFSFVPPDDEYYSFYMNKSGYKETRKALRFSDADGGKTFTLDFMLSPN